MPIHILPPEIAAKIAAGEVVERPASVVKELVENALDAGAKSISVNIAGAGRLLVEVADDGCGIPASELHLTVARHATSKLQDVDDLFHIRTLGFRGEALTSIGSVARMTITTRIRDSETGARLHTEGGQAGKVEQIGAPIGTVVRVEDLFYNVPARLKFLKKDVTERRAIDALLTRYALAYPEVRFRLSEKDKVALQTAGDGDRKAILAALYGVEVARQMFDVLADEEGLQLRGFISPNSLTRSNRREITFFINGRWVQNIPLSTALLQAYHTMLMVGRYPLATLFLTIPPEEVDVNVHPTKAEVRFRDQDKIFNFVQRAVRRALLTSSPVPEVSPQALWGSHTRQVDPTWSLAHDNNRLQADAQPEMMRGEPNSASESQTATVSQPLISKRMPLLRLIGQVGATYLVAEGPDGLYLIDQHAAHERVLFEKLMTQHEQKSVPSQALLSPAVVQLPPAQATLLTSQLHVLAHFGFEIEPFGPNTFQVRAIPDLFVGSDPAAALLSIVEDIEEDETPLQAETEARLAARVCKCMAVKSGELLSSEEQRALLTDLEHCDSPRTCPHGRPTMIHLSVEVLERQFGRAGAR